MATKCENPFNFGTQNYLIFEHLLRGRSISQVEAAEVFKIRRLASRIHELREIGLNVKRQMKADALGQKYARYHLGRPYFIV